NRPGADGQHSNRSPRSRQRSDRGRLCCEPRASRRQHYRGVFRFPRLQQEWLEALREAVPQLTAVAVLWDPAVGPYQVRSVETAAQSLGFTLALLEVRRPSELEPAFRSIVQKGAGAVVMLASTVTGSATKLLADLALKHRLPAITPFTEFARNGGLMAYGPNLLGVIRQQGVM